MQVAQLRFFALRIGNGAKWQRMVATGRFFPGPDLHSLPEEIIFKENGLFPVLKRMCGKEVAENETIYCSVFAGIDALG